MPPSQELDKVYDPTAVETAIYAAWQDRGCFDATPDDRPRDRRYCIVIPPPNVTGALHLGHALNNTLQDILVRWQRMRGRTTLWLPGTDHAGIATQAVVEKRLNQEEGKSRHDLGRDALVERIWAWKDQYEKRILTQLKQIGASCDWRKTRFTLDSGLAGAVRQTFFRMFKDGLIFRGKRLVNWDTQLQTAVADDEVYHETVKGNFWNFRYPVNDPGPGEPDHVIIATTRPETLLGDTAVAVHPDPAAALDRQEQELRARMGDAAEREKPSLQAQLDALAERRTTHLPLLVQLRDMARAGRTLKLPPLDERDIPLITDEHADPLLGTGCVKITPAHDHNDYEVGLRARIPLLNMMAPDGTVNEVGGPYQGLTMPAARERIVADMDTRELLAEVQAKDIDLGHSDRSKSPVEPYLSDQWFLNMARLAEPALAAVAEKRVKFFPERYAKTYLDWLGEKRDWCISRQLWWGHRIPVWTVVPRDGADLPADAAATIAAYFAALGLADHVAVQGNPAAGELLVCAGTTDAIDALAALATVGADDDAFFKTDAGEFKSTALEQACAAASGLRDRVKAIAQDPDVLDTWFSSALWPHSTLGWPATTDDLAYFYPTSVLVTSRDIITLWVVRMVVTGLYNMGEIPFEHVYIHTKILDGRGETMSKSKGNGVDPLDIVQAYGADALRYTMAEMATETQDVRMPVDYVCPHCSHLTPQATVVPRGKQPKDIDKLKCKSCKKAFATQWAPAALRQELPVARESSEKFDIGRNFCNKLWNSARFAFMNLDNVPCAPIEISALPPEDRWILACLSRTVRDLHVELTAYHFSPAIKLLRDFFWDAFCDWYVELSKPRLRDPQLAPVARQVLAFVLDQVLRLTSPFLPFITERLWAELNRLAPQRGLPGVAEAPASDMLMMAAYPPTDGWSACDDPAVLIMFADIQAAVRGVRDLRNKCNVPNNDKVVVTIKSTTEHLDLLRDQAHIVAEMAGVQDLQLVTDVERPRNAGTTVIGPLQIFVHDISDDAAERRRLDKELAGLDQRISGAQGKLGNAKFLANAKPEIIAAERDRLVELEKSRSAVLDSLADLAP